MYAYPAPIKPSWKASFHRNLPPNRVWKQSWYAKQLWKWATKKPEGTTGRMSHRKWKEIKQEPSMLLGPAVPGSCLVYFHFLWAIHPIRPVVPVVFFTSISCGSLTGTRSSLISATEAKSRSNSSSLINISISSLKSAFGTTLGDILLFFPQSGRVDNASPSCQFW